MRSLRPFRPYCAVAVCLLAGCVSKSAPPAPQVENSEPQAGSLVTVVPDIPQPKIPDRTFNILDYGAVADGKTLNTDAITKAIDACNKAGGGTVVIPAGTFLTGPLSLNSNLNLHLDKDATLLFSNDTKDFKLIGNAYENCIAVHECHDVAITGDGTIDGQGAFWWKNFVRKRGGPDADPDAKPLAHRPYMVVISRCQRVLVQGVHLKNSPMFNLVPKNCDDVTIDGITITSPRLAKDKDAPNTDGIDPSGHNILITRCTIDTGDDCIAVKPTTIDPPNICVENLFITHCTFLHGHGMSVGGGSPGGLRNMLVRDCTFDGTKAGLRLKAPRRDGGIAENITYENITMKNMGDPIEFMSYYVDNAIGNGVPKDLIDDPAQPIGPHTPIWRNILIQNVTAVDCKTGGNIVGLPEMPISNVVLRNVQISGQAPMRILHGRDIHFENSKITASSRPSVFLFDSKIDGLDPDSGE